MWSPTHGVVGGCFRDMIIISFLTDMDKGLSYGTDCGVTAPDSLVLAVRLLSFPWTGRARHSELLIPHIVHRRYPTSTPS